MSSDATTLSEVRQFLSSALQTEVQTVQFPATSTRSQSQQPAASELSRATFPRTRPATEAERQRDIGSKLPASGGTYKRMAFFVVGDDHAMVKCQRDWTWDRVMGGEAEVNGAADADSGDEDDDTDMDPGGAATQEKAQQSAAKLARMYGLRVLPLCVRLLSGKMTRLEAECLTGTDRLQGRLATSASRLSRLV